MSRYDREMPIHSDVVIPVGAEALFHSLSDPSRLKIVACLTHGEHCVRDLVAEVGLAQSTVSEHVACLRDCGLVEGRAQGRRVYYTLTCAAIVDLLQAANRVLEATGHQVENCPRYGKAGPATTIAPKPVAQ
jgi:DNA-binding transcriptional ArsR family regulator